VLKRLMVGPLAVFFASGWAMLQIVDAFIDNGILPRWAFKGALILLAIGLPIVIATAIVQGIRQARIAREVPVTQHRLLTWRNAFLGGAAAFTLLAVLAGAWMGMRALGLGSVGTLEARGLIKEGASVVLGDFASGSDAELGDVVTRALRVDLMQSKMIKVVDRTQLNAPLERMQAKPDARITSEVATQLAEREGYDAIITGDVAKAGSGYVLTANIRAGDGFLPVAAFRETARSEDHLIEAIENLSRAIRDKAGESLRTVQGGESLAQVTTSSLPALRAYTRGEARSNVGDHSGALEHYEQAVAADSTFAMAYRKIANSLTLLFIRRGDAVRAYTRAYELRDRLPELERYLAASSYHRNVTGDNAANVRALEQAFEYDSMSLTVRTNLGVAYLRQARYADAGRHFSALLKTRPSASLWQNLAVTRFRMGDQKGGLATLDSAYAALPEFANAFTVKAMLAMTMLDVRAADSAATLLEQKARTVLERENVRWMRLELATMRGQLREAARVLAGPAELDMKEPITNAVERSVRLVMRGDTGTAIRIVKEAYATHPHDGVHAEAAYGLAVAGDAAGATTVLDAWKQAEPDDQVGQGGRDNRDIVTAMTLRLRGDFAGGLRHLQAVNDRNPGVGAKYDLEMGMTYDAMGNAAKALEYYESALHKNDSDIVFMSPMLMRAIVRLGELHDEQGNTAKAIEYYAKLSELWRDADPELQPFVRNAQQRVQVLTTNVRS
jgi:eukaryotic-like serine/threonine-protein kinase